MYKKFLKTLAIILSCLLFFLTFGLGARGASNPEVPLGSAQNVPLKVTHISGDIFKGGTIFAIGESSPYALIYIRVKSDKGAFIYSANIGADYQGNWSAELDQPLKDGSYYIEAVAKNENGALSSPVRSESVYVTGPFAFIIGGLLVLIIILSIGFVCGWYIAKSREIKRYKRIITSQRDINLSYNIIKGDIDGALKCLNYFQAGHYKEKGKINEALFLLGRAGEDLKKTGEYILHGVSAIGKYDKMGRRAQALENKQLKVKK